MNFRKSIIRSATLSLSLLLVLASNAQLALATEPAQTSPAPKPQTGTSSATSPIIYLKDIDGDKKDKSKENAVRQSVPEDVFVVQLEDGANKDDFDSLLKQLHAKQIDTLKVAQAEFLIVQAEPGRADETEKKLLKDKTVSIIQRNRAAHYNQVPNDVSFTTEWDLSFMNYTQARSLGLGTRSPVTMYFLDSGVSPVSYELCPDIRQYDFANPTHPTGRQERPFDSFNHGTATATVTCTTDNIYGFAGMANFEQNRCSVVECRIGSGSAVYFIGVLYALVFIYQQRAAYLMPAGPVNVSAGAIPPNPSWNSYPIVQAISRALQQQGCLVVFAAGNDDIVDSSPELYARRVAAIAQDGSIASFSNTGPFFAAAPGVEVPCYSPYYYPYATFSDGTSFAAPRWCAAIADVMAVLPPSLKNAVFADQIVFSTATVTSQGYHVPNLVAALQAASRY